MFEILLNFKISFVSFQLTIFCFLDSDSGSSSSGESDAAKDSVALEPSKACPPFQSCFGFIGWFGFLGMHLIINISGSSLWCFLVYSSHHFLNYDRTP